MHQILIIRYSIKNYCKYGETFSDTFSAACVTLDSAFSSFEFTFSIISSGDFAPGILEE